MMFLKSMISHLLLIAYGSTAIRRHPGVDEKMEIFSDAVRRMRSGKAIVVSTRFEKLLQEWEGSSWSASANFSAVVRQIETDLINSTENQHQVEQNDLDKRMNEIACKNILVNNAHQSAVAADEAVFKAIGDEEVQALKLSKALTKLKNLDLIAQRSSRKKAAPSYSYTGGFNEDLEEFSCEFDKDSDHASNCDKSFSTYKSKADDDVTKVRDDLTLENNTWVGFKAEADNLLSEVSAAKDAAKSEYEEWVNLNEVSRVAFKLREHHICFVQKGLDGTNLNHPSLYYGLADYSKADRLDNQICKKDDNIPISFQRQHTDFCFLESKMLATQAVLNVANNSGAQPDQDYELQVLRTILCILNRLDIADSNLTDTDVSTLVSSCEDSESKQQIDPYVYESSNVLDCKKHVQYTVSDATTLNDENWCFSDFDDTSRGESDAAITFVTFLEGSPSNPSCEDVYSSGGATVEFFNKMRLRWKATMNSDHPLTSQATWQSASNGVVVDNNFNELGQSGKGFLRTSRQDSFYNWAVTASGTKCTWDAATASSETGWESKLVGADAQRCAFPDVNEYVASEFVPTYKVSGEDNYHHGTEEIIQQCELV